MSLNSDDTATLKAVYRLALGALRHTHAVDDRVMSRLADTTMEVCSSARDLRLPSTTEQIEDLAMLSIEMLVNFHAEVLEHQH